MQTEFCHIPVLLQETVNALAVKTDGRYLDGTIGLGGHAFALLNRFPSIQLCGLDRDEMALNITREKLRQFENRVHLFQLPFADFTSALNQCGWDYIDGALLDLGVSSLQLDMSERGFSFNAEGPIDMRMNQMQEVSAMDLINKSEFEEMRNWFAEFGEEPLAAKIAAHICEERKKQKIATTGRLAKIICDAYPAQWRKKAKNHPATRAFQALRIVVNDELGQLKSFLAQILKWLSPQGRLVIISFHSLEDRIVKKTFTSWSKNCICPPRAGKCNCNHRAEVKILYKKPLIAGDCELKNNSRARCAKLRAAEKI